MCVQVREKYSFSLILQKYHVIKRETIQKAQSLTAIDSCKGAAMVCEFKVSDLAREFGVHRNTIRNWINSGRLQARPGPGRRYLIDSAEYERFCRNLGRPARPLPADQPATVGELAHTALKPLVLEEQEKTICQDPTWGDTCLTCGSCAAACPLTGVDGLDPQKIVRMAFFGLDRELEESDWPWKCTLCGRCEEACPMGIEIVLLMRTIRGRRPGERVPGPLHRGVATCLARGNNMGIPREDCLTLLTALGRDLARTADPSFVTPIDHHGARLLVTINSKEPFSEPANLLWWWRIFEAAGESWTIASRHWEGVNWAYLTGDESAMKTLVHRLVDTLRSLNCRALLLPECGHAYFATRLGLHRWYPEVLEEFTIYSVFDLLLEYLHQKRIRLNKTAHTQPAAWHDSCHYGRISLKYFGQAYFAAGREIMDHCCSHRVELHPNRRDNYCCGAGGSAWTSDFAAERVFGGRLKARQIRESGARLVVTACHNCRDQIQQSLNHEFGLAVEVKYLWQVVAEALVTTH